MLIVNVFDFSLNHFILKLVKEEKRTVFCIVMTQGHKYSDSCEVQTHFSVVRLTRLAWLELTLDGAPRKLYITRAMT